MVKKILHFIHKCTKQGRIQLKTHAVIRMTERKIKIHELEEALLDSTLIEKYPDDTPLESCLLLGYTQHEKPLHIVTALDTAEQYIWIITVYRPDKNKWNQSLTKRKRL